MTPDAKFSLLLIVARVLRARIANEIYAEQVNDLAALNEALAPFGPLPGPPVNEERRSAADPVVWLPQYRSHKIVRAIKIADVEIRDDGSAVITPVVDGDAAPQIYTSGGWSGRYKGSPADFGYYVRYEDGYESWSPTKAFEEGYTRV